MRRIFFFPLLLVFFFDFALSSPPSDAKFEWIRSARIFLLDVYAYPFFPKIEFDAEKMAETMVDMHANTLRIGTSGKYCMIPGIEFVTHPELGERDILAECIAACKPHGIRVVAYIATEHAVPTEIIENHRPEWAQWVNPNGDIYRFRNQGGGTVTTLCWNTPYRDAFIGLVRKVVSEYDVDGMYFDTWRATYFYPPPYVCYCPGCRKGFKEAEGLELPYKPDINDYTPEELSIIERYRKWRSEELVALFNETKKIIKSYKDIPMIYNTGHASRIFDQDRRIVEGSDAFLYERGKSMLERAEGISLAVSHGMSVWPYIGGYDGWQRVVHNKLELQQEIFTTAAFGGAPILAQFYYWVNEPAPEGRKPVKDAFRILEENEKYISGFYPLKYCAVVWNDKDPPGHVVKSFLWETDARKCTLGAFAACIYNHIQTTSILKENLNDSEFLNQYKVLYLPDICYLSDAQISAIESFVRNGGGLVMTYGTSLYDEKGKKRTNFALGRLAGIQYVNPNEELTEKIKENLSFGGVWDLYMKVRHGKNIIPFTDRLIPVFLYQPVNPIYGATVAADIIIGADSELLAPGLVLNRYGKGRIAYIPAALDAAYLQTHIQQFADFLKNVIESVSPVELPYEINAPSSLIANMTSKGNTKVLHLINWTGCKIERIQQNVYYIPPIENVSIKFNIPKGKNIKSINLFVPAPFSQHIEDDALFINFPRIDNYQAIAIEME